MALVTLTACGRLSFDPVFDARSSPGDGDDLPLYASLVLADAPRAYFRLGETAGPVVQDATGNGDDTTYGAAGGTFEFGVPGALTRDADTAVRIEGTNVMTARIELGVVGDTWAGDFTVEMFVQPLATPPDAASYDLFICEDYLVNGFRFARDLQDRFAAWTTEAGGTSALTTTQQITKFAWNHVVLVREGTTFAIYRDAELLAASVFDYIPAGPSAVCGFGAHHGLGNNSIFDEVAIYERALSPATIAAHFAAR